MTAITGFGVLDIAANFSLVRLPPLLSPFLWLPHQLCHLLSPLLLLCPLPPALPAKWRATPELL